MSTMEFYAFQQPRDTVSTPEIAGLKPYPANSDVSASNSTTLKLYQPFTFATKLVQETIDASPPTNRWGHIRLVLDDPQRSVWFDFRRKSVVFYSWSGIVFALVLE